MRLQPPPAPPTPTGPDLRYYDQPELWLEDGPIGHPDQLMRADRVTDEVLGLRPSRVLEIGAGNGIIANRLTAAGLDVVATDISPEALRGVEGQAIVASADDLPFPDRSFDLTVASEVLEHLASPILEQAGRELERVTDRWLVLTVPNEEDLEAAAVRCPVCTCRFHAHRHLQRFDPDRLAHVIPGFRAIKVLRFGPRDIHVSHLEASIRRDLLGRTTAWSPVAVCPQCGYRSNGRSAPPKPRWRGLLTRPIRRRRQRWLLAVLERAEPA